MHTLPLKSLRYKYENKPSHLPFSHRHRKSHLHFVYRQHTACMISGHDKSANLKTQCSSETQFHPVLQQNLLSIGIRYPISLVRNCTTSGQEGIGTEYLKNLPPVLIKTLARLFTHYLYEYNVPSQ
ncbi:hypothetical protein DICVIV_08345 [Dictyocaulus viviparus]|uniref:Uncharacterized protein n=1 Tax=Dictyocaulus viviparus TaxID=29172 RepID=A0A0D8XP79_DICVI|nr:hypothetical protein DICVIV_08345 [Dictyocaulus viviparus]